MKAQGREAITEFFINFSNELFLRADGATVFIKFIAIAYGYLLSLVTGLEVKNRSTEWTSFIDLTWLLMSHKAIAKGIMGIESKSLNLPLGEIESKTILGCVMRYSFIYGSAKCDLKDFIGEFSSGDEMIKALRYFLEEVNGTAISFIKAMYYDQDLKEIINWFINIADKNKDLRKLVHGNDFSNPGFISNATEAMLQLCEPFTKDRTNYPTTAKLIDPEYCSTGKLDYHYCLRINNGYSISSEEKKSEVAYQSELFFLTHYLLSLCFCDIYELLKKWAMSGNTDINTKFNICAASAQLNRKNYVESLFDFITFSIYVLLSKIKPSDSSLKEYMSSGYSFPLPELPPYKLAAMPDHILKNIDDTLQIYARFRFPKVYEDGLLDLAIKLYISLLIKPYNQNLHLRKGLAITLESLVRVYGSSPNSVLENEPILNNHIIEATAELYFFTDKDPPIDRLSYRRASLDTLSSMLAKDHIMKQWKSIIDKERTKMFLAIVLREFTDGSNELIDGFKRLREVEEQFTNPISLIYNQGILHLSNEYHEYKKIIMRYSGLVIVILSFLEKIIVETPNIFIDERVKKQFAFTLNFMLKHFTTSLYLIEVI